MIRWTFAPFTFNEAKKDTSITEYPMVTNVYCSFSVFMTSKKYR